MAYTTINKSGDYFNTKLYTGNGSTQNITGVGFQPDWIWQKERSSTSYHVVTDAVRGNTKQLFTNVNATEATDSNYITSFDSDGFGQGQNNDTNESGQTYVAWNWKANGQGSSNTDGSINTTYTSVNTTAGFSISSYTGNGTAGATIGHGLGTAPKVVLIKRRSAGGEWIMGHGSLGFTKFLELNLTGGEQTSTLRFNDTAPTSSVFTVGSTADTNQNGTTLIAYCFAEKTGYSKFGSLTGNGSSDGTFVYCGFAPSFILVKAITSGNWFMYDNKRPGYNNVQQFLEADGTAVEYTSNANHSIDILSNGFKFTGGSGSNTSGRESIFMAFGQSIVGSNNIPATAR